MKMVASQIVPNHHLERAGCTTQERVEFIRKELSDSVIETLLEMEPLFYVEQKESIGQEHRMEMFFFSTQTFNNIMLTLQENDIKKTVREKIRDILINSI